MNITKNVSHHVSRGLNLLLTGVLLLTPFAIVRHENAELSAPLGETVLAHAAQMARFGDTGLAAFDLTQQRNNLLLCSGLFPDEE